MSRGNQREKDRLRAEKKNAGAVSPTIRDTL
jgi:hypothetical protein